MRATDPHFNSYADGHTDEDTNPKANCYANPGTQSHGTPTLRSQLVETKRG